MGQHLYSMLAGKKILIGVTGSIAAYKIATLVRLLVKTGAEVKVVMTASSQTFITPLTLATLSKNPVLSTFSQPDGTWNNHVELGLWADIFLIAPATARSLAKCVNGLADDLLTATYLSARCPVWFAPAMDLDMYQHSSTLHNINTLRSYGNVIVPAENGELASGLSGEGRMAEPENLVALLENHFGQLPELIGKKVLLTAGPTQEALDPVRFLSNHSTGKMGYALAERFAQAGASVTLVSGPTALPVPVGVTLVKVRSATEMHQACEQLFPETDIAVLAAAVADYTPVSVASQKIKKTESTFALQLTRTPDIAASLGKIKQKHQFILGFALETNNEVANAEAKLVRKNFDAIVLNSLRDPGAGFGHDTNKITLLDRLGHKEDFPLKTKKALAEDLVRWITRYFQ